MKAREFASAAVHSLNLHYYPRWQDIGRNQEIAGLLSEPIRELVGKVAVLDGDPDRLILAKPSRLLGFLDKSKDTMSQRQFSAIVAGVNAAGVILEHGGTILYEQDTSNSSWDFERRFGFKFDSEYSPTEAGYLGRMYWVMGKNLKSSFTTEIILPGKRISDLIEAPVRRHPFDKFIMGMRYLKLVPNTTDGNSADFIGQRALIGLIQEAVESAMWPLPPEEKEKFRNIGRQIFDHILYDVVDARISQSLSRRKQLN